MARIHTSDVIDGSGYSEDGDGPKVTRVFQIVEVTGPKESRHIIAANVAGVPQINEFHPSIFGLQCVSKKANAEGATTYKVSCEYKRIDQDGGEGDPSPKTQITVGSTLQTVQENLDYQGRFLTVEYTAELESDGENEIPEADREPDDQNKTIDKLEPMTVIKFRRREFDPPEQESVANVGKLNSSSFLGSPPKTILCTRIEGSSTDGGETYDVDYEFQRRIDGWDVTLFYRNSEGDIPLDVGKVDGENGVNEFQIYKTTDFNSLDLQ